MAKLTAIDIQKQEFAKILKGYDPREVHAFLERVAGEFENLHEEIQRLNREGDGLREQIEQLRGRETAVKEALETAQKITTDIKEGAKKEAEITLKRAELQAEKIVRGAHDRMVGLIEDINDLKRQRAKFEAALIHLCESHLDMLQAVTDNEAQKNRIEENLAVLRRVKQNVDENGEPQTKAKRGA